MHIKFHIRLPLVSGVPGRRYLRAAMRTRRAYENLLLVLFTVNYFSRKVG